MIEKYITKTSEVLSLQRFFCVYMMFVSVVSDSDFAVSAYLLYRSANADRTRDVATKVKNANLGYTVSSIFVEIRGDLSNSRLMIEVLTVYIRTAITTEAALTAAKGREPVVMKLFFRELLVRDIPKNNWKIVWTEKAIKMRNRRIMLSKVAKCESTKNCVVMEAEVPTRKRVEAVLSPPLDFPSPDT